MMDIIKIYYKFHPLRDVDNYIIPFLVSYNGNHLKLNNSINEILRKINKNFNSTMFRHSYISYNFKDSNIKSKLTAENMGHSQILQRQYII